MYKYIGSVIHARVVRVLRYTLLLIFFFCLYSNVFQYLVAFIIIDIYNIRSHTR